MEIMAMPGYRLPRRSVRVAHRRAVANTADYRTQALRGQVTGIYKPATFNNSRPCFVPLITNHPRSHPPFFSARATTFVHD
jgi:hypothetical protein